MFKTAQEVDDFLKIKVSKEFIRDVFMGKIEIPEMLGRKNFESTAKNINKYVPDLVNTKWCNCEKKVNDENAFCPLHDSEQ